MLEAPIPRHAPVLTASVDVDHQTPSGALNFGSRKHRQPSTIVRANANSLTLGSGSALSIG
jgi:hypothetical protein